MVPRTFVTTATCMLLATAARAQSVEFVPHTGHYGVLGGGRHGLALTCDSLCPSATQGTGALNFALGRHFSRRVRVEFAGSFGTNTERRSTFLSAGLAGYIVGGVHVRGAVTSTQLNIEDTTVTFDFRGGPGFLVGGGIDLPLGRTWAFTPYVSWVSSSAKAIDVTGGRTTAGSFTSLNIGATLTRLAGTFRCTNAAGERIWVRPRYRTRALECLREVEARMNGRPTGIKL